MSTSATLHDLYTRLANSDDGTPEGIQEFNTAVFGSPLHDGQLKWELNANKQVNILVPGNSWGKTEMIARRMVRKAWNKEGTDPERWMESDWRGLIASYGYEIAKESFQRLRHLHNQGGNFSKLVAKVYNSDPPYIVMNNGAIINFGSLQDGGRLIEATRRNSIMVDEVGQIPDFKNVYESVVYPRTLGVGGVIDLIGTPKPDTDPWVFEIYELGRRGHEFYYTQQGNVWENSYWTDEERTRVRANPVYFNSDGSLTEIGKQVINGEFIQAGGLFFNRLHVARMFSGDWQLPASPTPGHFYLQAWDLGGRKKYSDATVYMTLDISEQPWRLVDYGRWVGSETDWEQKFQLIKEKNDLWKPPYVLVDVTGSTRDSIAEELEKRGVPIEGIHFGGNAGGKKFDYMRALQSALEMECQDGEGRQHRGLLRFPSVGIAPEMAQVKKEFDFYRLQDQHLVQDCVMTAAMLAYHAMLDLLPEAYVGEAY